MRFSCVCMQTYVHACVYVCVRAGVGVCVCVCHAGASIQQGPVSTRRLAEDCAKDTAADKCVNQQTKHPPSSTNLRHR